MLPRRRVIGRGDLREHRTSAAMPATRRSPGTFERHRGPSCPCGERVPQAILLGIPADRRLVFGAKIGHGVFERLEPAAIESVPPPLLLGTDVDEAGIPQEPQVLGHRRPADPELAADRVRQLSRRVLTARKHLDEPPPHGIGERFERMHAPTLSMHRRARGGAAARCGQPGPGALLGRRPPSRFGQGVCLKRPMNLLLTRAPAAVQIVDGFELFVRWWPAPCFHARR